jgi:hypothetical protein
VHKLNNLPYMNSLSCMNSTVYGYEPKQTCSCKFLCSLCCH